jgi:DNA-directed RNA polymerase subunit RPC12/RpoP
MRCVPNLPTRIGCPKCGKGLMFAGHGVKPIKDETHYLYKCRACGHEVAYTLKDGSWLFKK